MRNRTKGMRTLIYATLGGVIGSDFALVKAAEPYYTLQQAMAWPGKITKSGLGSLEKETSLIADILAI